MIEDDEEEEGEIRDEFMANPETGDQINDFKGMSTADIV